MKIVILSQYFPPEVGAPQNRLYELAQRLHARGHGITVFTAMPNYPAMKVHPEYRGKWFTSETMNNLKVYRSWIWVSSSKRILSRLLNYFSFVFSAAIWATLKMKRSDVLICESPPLFLGLTARWLAFVKRTPLLFNVSDLWPESAEKLGLVTNKRILALTTRLEESTYKASRLISGQTQGIVHDIQRRMPNKNVFWLPNGVDGGFYDPQAFDRRWRSKQGFAEEDVLLLYAGIIGHAQGLDVILDAAAKLGSGAQTRWLLLGAGPEKERLMDRVVSESIPHVHFFDVVGKSEMPWIIASSDAAVVPLRKLDLFLGAIPSKIFENLAMEKPLLLGVDGESRSLFIDQAQAGLFFEPENSDALAKAASQLAGNATQRQDMGRSGRRYIQANFSRDLIAARFEAFLEEHLGKGKL